MVPRKRGDAGPVALCLPGGKQTEEEVGRQHQGMDRPGVRQVQEGG